MFVYLCQPQSSSSHISSLYIIVAATDRCTTESNNEETRKRVMANMKQSFRRRICSTDNSRRSLFLLSSLTFLQRNKTTRPHQKQKENLLKTNFSEACAADDFDFSSGSHAKFVRRIGRLLLFFLWQRKNFQYKPAKQGKIYFISPL